MRLLILAICLLSGCSSTDLAGAGAAFSGMSRGMSGSPAQPVRQRCIARQQGPYVVTDCQPVP